MDIDQLTIGQAKELAALFADKIAKSVHHHLANPLIGQCVLVRTYSAGVHIGTLEQAVGRECLLSNSLRLWRWSGGGLSLSAVANSGIKGGRLNRTGKVFLTEAIEFIPVTTDAWNSYELYIED